VSAAATPPAPRVGVGAFIRHADGRLLLVKRKRAPEAGCWGLPGGKVEPRETCADAVVREIAEELGVAITLGGLHALSELIDADGQYHWLAPIYAATITHGEPQVCEPDALADWGWFDTEAPPSPLTQATRDALAVR